MAPALMRLRKLGGEEEEKRKQWREEGLKERLREGREEERQRRQAWWLRQIEEMRAVGLSFDEPPITEQTC